MSPVGSMAGTGTAGSAGMDAMAGMMAAPMAGVGGAGAGAPEEGSGGPQAGDGAPEAGSGGVGGMDEAGSGGVGGMDEAGSGGAAGMEPEPRADLGEGDGSDVITIGDSWMSLFTTGIQQSLLEVSGRPYRTYGVPGTRLLNEAIPGQYTQAKDENPDIATVIMTGGGNDIIQVPGLEEDCDAGGDLCVMEVGMILDRLSDLWTEMATDGVQDVVYVQYSRPDQSTVDFALPDGDSVIERCANVPEPLRCHTLDTVDLVMGDVPDGIHPSAAGYDRIGEAVYDLMIERGMRR